MASQSSTGGSHKNSPREQPDKELSAWLRSPVLYGEAEMYIQLHMISVTRILIILQPMLVVSVCKVIKFPSGCKDWLCLHNAKDKTEL